MNFKNIDFNKTAFIIIVLIFIVLFLQMLARDNEIPGNDFTSYLLSASNLLNNKNPYFTNSPFTYIYPITLAFILIPVVFLPVILAQILWYMLNLFILFKIIDIIFRELNIPFKKFKMVLILFLIITMFNIIQNNLINGQVNLLILLLCILSYSYYRRNKIYMPAFILALAVSIKILPAFIILYFLIRKEYKLIIATISFSLFILMLPVILTGNKIIDYYSYYIQNIILTHVSFSSQPSEMFFNLYGLLKYVFPTDRLGIGLNIASVLLILFAFVCIEWIQKNKTAELRATTFFLYPLGFLLISPISETHHLIFILPCFQLFFTRVSLENYQHKSNVLNIIITVIIISLIFTAKEINYSFYFLAVIIISLGYIKVFLFNKVSQNSMGIIQGF